MSHAFIDRTCPTCNGNGCDACHGGQSLSVDYDTPSDEQRAVIDAMMNT